MALTRTLPIIVVIAMTALSCKSSATQNATQTLGAPLVGVSSSRGSDGTDRISTNYTEAVRRAGGIPVIIPTVSTVEAAADIISRLDGIVFSGGVDVDPSWYGEEVLNETVEIDRVRDVSDSLLARAALEGGMPILAICRGEQLLNVILGGTLYQDIPSQLERPLAHSGGVTHTVGIEQGSILSQLFGTDSLTVNSSHHQAVKDPAPGVRVTARSSDGIIEAYENDQIWAVQFHPERLREFDPLFAAYISRLK